MNAIRHRLYAACLGAALVAGCGGGGGGSPPPPVPPPPPSVPPAYTATGKAAAGDTIVHLFEWRWADIARECEVWLGPKGFKGVQVSPPSEHAVFAGNGYPWWQRYQTVSYRLNQSRSGTQAEFENMVQRCRAVGVDIYADAVINHMTAGSGTGSAGSAYTKYSYPAVPYAATDFHGGCSINSYQDQFQVQNCELVGLSDLKTEDDSVRTKIANYLIALHTLGVAGFRIDAAKHIPAWDIDQILKKVNDAAAAAVPPRPRPYVFLEVINNPNEAVTANQYYGVGTYLGGSSTAGAGSDITEFQFGYRVTDAFLGRNGASLDSALLNLPAASMPSDKAMVFVDNHDNQRGDNLYYASTFAGQPVYELAQVYTLAQSVGVVSVMSGYGFDRSTQAGRDAGPPGAGGVTQSTFTDITAGTSRCSAALGTPQVGSWVCEHRSRAIANMVAFRRATAGSPLTNCGRANWTFGDANRVAFCRDGTGAVALNKTAQGQTVTLISTGLPSGNYCNIAQFDYTPASSGSPASCPGAGAVIGVASGQAIVNVPAWGAVAIHINARL
jgi:alpha-amylase